MLADEVGKMLRLRNETLAVAESCTGGKVGDMVTDVPGSSEYFLGGIISYSNEAKMKFLGVHRDVLKAKGAVSEEVAIQMAIGVRGAMGSTYGVGITGIAGPTGGSKAKPIGLVYIAVASADREKCERHIFKGSRTDIKKAAATRSLEMLLEFVS